jgi:hypothetical protein
MKFPLLLLSFLLAAISVSAQVDPQCPTVAVHRPVAILSAGKPFIYSVAVVPADSTLTYKWSVSHGTIWSGQGTSTIKVSVVPDEHDLSVTVEVVGLPKVCPNIASETVSDLNRDRPFASKVDTLFLPLSSVSESRFRNVGTVINNNQTSQLYIFLPGVNSVREELIRRLYEFIHGDFDLPRVTFVETVSTSKVIEIWIVPPGAQPPACRECSTSRDQESDFVDSITRSPSPKARCPKLAIIAPTKINMPGSIISFRAKVSGRRPIKITYKWSVNAGKIESGQGTRLVKVRTPIGQDISSVRAYLTVRGLNPICDSSTSVVAGLANQPVVDPFDRYGDVSFDIEKEKLRSAFEILAKYPKVRLLLIKRSPANVGGKRINDIRSFILNNLQMSPDRFQLVRTTGNQAETVIWFVKPGTNVAALIGSN